MLKFLGTDRLPHCDFTITAGGLGTYNYVRSVDGNRLVAYIYGGIPANWFIEGQELILTVNFSNSTSASANFNVVSGDIGATTLTLEAQISQDYSSWTSAVSLEVKQYCPNSSNYFTGERLKFLLSPWQQATNGITYQLTGVPTIKFIMIGATGQEVKFAQLNETSSNISSGYLQFDYIIQGTDNGAIRFDGIDPINTIYNPFINDNENTILYRDVAYNELTGEQYDLSLYNLFNYSYSNNNYYYSNNTSLSRVSINMGSGLYTGNQCRILLKRSEEEGKTPTAQDLLGGEICLNLHDGKIFMKKTDDSIVSIALN
jgi:hypothetical protein